MGCILVLRDPNPVNADLYYLSGTGWQSVKASATSYSTKEASMVDGITQREALGPGARLSVDDQVTGETHPIPVLDQGPVLIGLQIQPQEPAIVGSGTLQLGLTGTRSDGTVGPIYSGVTWASATTGHATVSSSGLLTWVAAGTSVITATVGSVVGQTIATMS
jgi:hypothetical protein